MQYPAHEAFVAPARAYPQLWRLILGGLLAVILYTCFVFAVFGVAIWLAHGTDILQDLLSWRETGGIGPNPVETEILRIVAAETPTDMLVLLATFAGMVLGAIAAARLLHKRNFVSMTGPIPRLWRHFGIALAIALPILGLSAFLPPAVETEPNLNWRIWLNFVPLSLAVIMVQTGAEELLFRGYLQQQLAARFRSPIIWMVLPSVLFGLGHFNPDFYGAEAWLVVGVTAMVGLMAADLTARTGGLGAAWGLHFANNVGAILFLTLDGPMSGLSLFVVPAVFLPPGTLTYLILKDIAVIVVIWLSIRLVLRPSIAIPANPA